MQSPMKQNIQGDNMNSEMGGASGAKRRLNLDGETEAVRQHERKRKLKGASPVT